MALVSPLWPRPRLKLPARGPALCPLLSSYFSLCLAVCRCSQLQNIKNNNNKGAWLDPVVAGQGCGPGRWKGFYTWESPCGTLPVAAGARGTCVGRCFRRKVLFGVPPPAVSWLPLPLLVALEMVRLSLFLTDEV